ncbi:transmembrane protein 154-like isoform X2 [Myxocyprinus asiaticus]|uniref:transmembrane protein 154-like isoform X2 n=1 Tax=Myxocyprinus asiaticus TaxID=70543 RepID=UPI0022220628|nr:transmembrane protein 154-like isoform X2 [Myxocyprinus asiaticus]
MTLALLLLLALTASWTRRVQSEDKEQTETNTEDSILEENLVAGVVEEDPENHGNVSGSGDGRTQASIELGSAQSSESSGVDIEPTVGANTETDLNPVVMIIIPLVLTIVIIAVILCGVIISYRWTTNDFVAEEDPYLDHEDHEKVPMPMFEDDIPSVMELEMEDLENWMAKDGGTNVDTGQI